MTKLSKIAPRTLRLIKSNLEKQLSVCDTEKNSFQKIKIIGFSMKQHYTIMISGATEKDSFYYEKKEELINNVKIVIRKDNAKNSAFNEKLFSLNKYTLKKMFDTEWIDEPKLLNNENESI